MGNKHENLETEIVKIIFYKVKDEMVKSDIL